MTKTILVTNFTEINHVKVSCGKCGFAVNFPLDTKEIKIVWCKCGVQFPIDKIKTWLEAAYALKTALLTTCFSGAIVEIETEEKHGNEL